MGSETLTTSKFIYHEIGVKHSLRYKIGLCINPRLFETVPLTECRSDDDVGVGRIRDGQANSALTPLAWLSV